MNLDLKSLYKTLSWHKADRDHPPGEKVGLFIQVPEHIACQFPPKPGEDSSPPHITLLYIGNLPPSFEAKLDEVVGNVCENFKRFTVKLGSVKRFINDEQQKVYHSPVISKRLQVLHKTLLTEFQFGQLPYSTKYPEFKPHITIEYVNPGESPKFTDLCPEGSWEVDSVWVWGISEPKLYFLK
jgi:2'-5' RNA ligase